MYLDIIIMIRILVTMNMNELTGLHMFSSAFIFRTLQTSDRVMCLILIIISTQAHPIETYQTTELYTDLCCEQGRSFVNTHSTEM